MDKTSHPVYSAFARLDARRKVIWAPPIGKRGGVEYPSGDRYIVDENGCYRKQPKASVNPQ